MEPEAARRMVLATIAMLLLAGCAGATLEDEPIDVFSSAPGDDGPFRMDDDLAHVLAPGPYAPLAPEVVELMSEADGERFSLHLVRPDVPAGTLVPIILEASPYFLDGNSPSIEDEFSYRRYVENFVPHGYAAAFLPVRGSADQGGCSDVMGALERSDLDQAVTWLGTRAWSNGNVGMIGLSYAGATAWEVASTGNPHLKTIVPIAGVNDLHDLMYRNGSHEWRGNHRFMYSYYVANGPQEFNALENNRGLEHTGDMIICPGIPRAFAASAHATLATGEDPLGFWAERDLRPGVEERYRGSIFSIQGLQDWNVDPAHTYPWVASLEAHGIVVKHLLGQWDHRWPDSANDDDGAGRRMDVAEVLLRWFDRWLKEDTAVRVGPRVEVQDASLRWRVEELWPPEDATPLRFFLTPDGKLAGEPAPGEARLPVAPDPFKLQPSEDEISDPDIACPVCPRFESDQLEQEIRIAGIPPVPLTLVPSAPFGHISAWLYAIDGSQATRVGWGAIDLRFAEGTGEPREVTPGAKLVVRLQLEPIDAVVPAGARLALLVHQGSYGDHTASVPTAPVELVVGGEASYVELPTITRDASAFFDPPTA